MEKATEARRALRSTEGIQDVEKIPRRLRRENRRGEFR